MPAAKKLPMQCYKFHNKKIILADNKKKKIEKTSK